MAVLGHNAVAVLEQVQEHLKHLWLDRHHLAGTAQLMAVCVEDAVPKGIEHDPATALSLLTALSLSATKSPVQ